MPQFVAELTIPEDVPGRAKNIGWPVATADLGALAVGESHKFGFSIFNPTSSDIEFRKVVAGCSCGQVSFESNVFPAGKYLKGNLIYTAPNSSVRSEAKLSIFFYNTEDRADSIPVAGMRVTLTLAENLAVVTSSNQLVIEGTEDNRFEYPITISSPIVAENLTVELSESLKSIRAFIESLQGKPHLVVIVPGQLVNSESLAGDIVVKDRVSEKEARLHFWIARRPEVTISPQYVRFRESPDDDGSYKARVLVRILPEQKTGEIPELVRLSCSSDGSPIEAVSRELGNGIYSISLELPRSMGGSRQSDSAFGGKSTGALEWHLELRTSEGESRTFYSTTSFEGVGQ